jgi:hypothetical protein
MRLTPYTKFHRMMLPKNVSIGSLSAPFKDILFKDNLFVENPEFDNLITDLVPLAIQVDFERQGLPRKTAKMVVEKAMLMDEIDTSISRQIEMKRAIFEGRLQEYMEFHIAGEQIFKFSEGLSDRLMHTSIDVPSGLFNMPYKSILVVHNTQESTQIAVDLINASKAKGLPEELKEKSADRLVLGISRRENNGVPEILISASVWWGSSDRGMQIGLSLGEDPSVNMPQLINESMRDLRKVEPNLQDVSDQNLESFLNLCINSCLYLVSKDADIGDHMSERDRCREKIKDPEASKKEKHLARQAMQVAAQTPYRDVGRNIAQTRFSSSYNEGDGSKQSGHGKLTKKFMVRGHYRNQAHGPAMSLRRLIFVEPFEKGPDAAELISRTYDVQDDPSRYVPDETPGIDI